MNIFLTVNASKLAQMCVNYMFLFAVSIIIFLDFIKHNSEF